MAATQSEVEERPLSELVQQASGQTARLVRQELRLAQLELQEKGRRAGIGVGAFGGAGMVALYGVGALIAAAILGLATAVAPWVAGLIAAAALFAVAGGLALLGREQVGRGTPPVPEQAIEGARRDVDEVRARASRS